MIVRKNFLDIYKDITASIPKIQQKNYKAEGDTSIIDQGLSSIAGYCNCKKRCERIPAIIFGDHTRIVKYIDVPFVLGADGAKALSVVEGVNPRYAYFLLKAFPIKNEGYRRHFPILKKKTILLDDDVTKQKLVVDILERKLSAVDALAEKTERQLQDAASLAARINKQTIEFDGKKQPISKYCSEDKRIIQPESEDAKTLKYLGMENIDKDTWAYIASTDILVSGNSTTYYFDENHVLYGKLRPYLKKVFLPELAGRCSTELIPFLPADTMEREYLALLLTDDDLVSYIMSESTGARMPRTDMKKLLAYKVAVPDIEEQRTRLKARNEQMKKCTVLIEKLRKQQENITALRECVFKEAFGNEE